MKLPRFLTVPASESQLGVALGLSLVVMSMLLYGIVWQAELIGHQRELIRWLWNFKLG